MAKQAKFSSCCGQNITLSDSKYTASWNLKSSGGNLFSKEPLHSGQSVLVQFAGSGQCTIGYVTEEPYRLDSSRPESDVWTVSTFHKQESSFQLTRHGNGSEGSLIWLGEDGVPCKQRLKIPRKTPIWLALNIRYGNVTVVLKHVESSEYLEFSRNHGSNIVLEDSNTTAKSFLHSRASICFFKKQLSVGEMMVLKCAPLQENGRTPMNYHLHLQVYENDPVTLRRKYSHLFDANDVPEGPSPVTSVVLLARNDCNGTVYIYMTSTSTIGYRSAKNKFSTANAPKSTTTGVWVVLELFRVSVSAAKQPFSDTVLNLDVIDAASKRPLSDAAQNIDVIDGVICEPSDINEHPQDAMSMVSNDDNTEVKQIVDCCDASLGGDGTSYNSINFPPNRCLENAYTSLSFEDSDHKHDTRLKQVVSGTDNPSNTPTEVSNHRSVHSGTAGKRLQPKVLNNLTTATTTSSRPNTINIRHNYTSLVRDIDCMPLLDMLFEKCIFTQSDCDNIEQIRNRADRNRALLRLLSQKNISKTAMDDILDAVEQSHLKERF